MGVKRLLLIFGGFGIIGVLTKIGLDTGRGIEYPPLHPGMCFERKVREPWEVNPLGRIEQDGVEHVLVTIGQDMKVRKVGTVYGFAVEKQEFHRAYKEVACRTQP